MPPRFCAHCGTPPATHYHAIATLPYHCNACCPYTACSYYHNPEPTHLSDQYTKLEETKFETTLPVEWEIIPKRKIIL